MSANKYSGRYNNQELESMVCRSWNHDGKHCTHFSNGEKKCRKCNIFYKLIWIHNHCMSCGTKLASSSRYRKREDSTRR